MYFTMLAGLQTALCLLATVSSAQDILLPSPKGPHNVTIRTSELTDFDRVDIYAPNNISRRLMISAFTPVHDTAECKSKYMLDSVAAYEKRFWESMPPPLNLSLDFSRIVLPICSIDVTRGAPSSAGEPDCQQRFPLVFFSPGHTASRFYHNLISSHLASYGYIVVTVDHPGDANIIEYPDHTFAYYSNKSDGTPEDPTNVVRNELVRSEDMTFVLDQLTSNKTLSHLLFPGAEPQSTNEVGIWGQSLGGATAFKTMLTDKRFVGGMNLDGTLWSNVTDAGLDRPFILWQHDDGPNTVTDSSWTKWWPRMSGFKRILRVQGTQHAGFMDGTLLADLAGIQVPLLGTIDGKLLVDTLVIYARDFFAMVLQNSGPGLLGSPSPEYPHVVFVDQ